MTGSVRSGSLNVALARAALDAVAARGAEIDWIDLGTYPLPIYHGTLEELHGPPVTAMLVQNTNPANVADRAGSSRTHSTG